MDASSRKLALAYAHRHSGLTFGRCPHTRPFPLHLPTKGRLFIFGNWGGSVLSIYLAWWLLWLEEGGNPQTPTRLRISGRSPRFVGVPACTLSRPLWGSWGQQSFHNPNIASRPPPRPWLSRWATNATGWWCCRRRVVGPSLRFFPLGSLLCCTPRLWPRCSLPVWFRGSSGHAAPPES